jgi:hypothetical protein
VWCEEQRERVDDDHTHDRRIRRIYRRAERGLERVENRERGMRVKRARELQPIERAGCVWRSGARDGECGGEARARERIARGIEPERSWVRVRAEQAEHEEERERLLSRRSAAAQAHRAAEGAHCLPDARVAGELEHLPACPPACDVVQLADPARELGRGPARALLRFLLQQRRARDPGRRRCLLTTLGKGEQVREGRGALRACSVRRWKESERSGVPGGGRMSSSTVRTFCEASARRRAGGGGGDSAAKRILASELDRKNKGKKGIIHRTGIEPVPLAWKASMITTSPSVFFIRVIRYIHIAQVSITWLDAVLRTAITPCPGPRFTRFSLWVHGLEGAAHGQDVRSTSACSPLPRRLFENQVPSGGVDACSLVHVSA